MEHVTFFTVLTILSLCCDLVALIWINKFFQRLHMNRLTEMDCLFLDHIYRTIQKDPHLRGQMTETDVFRALCYGAFIPYLNLCIIFGVINLMWKIRKEKRGN